HGKLGNAAGQLYVKVNNGAPINYPGGTAALAAPLWKPWNIDLATLGNIAKSVTTLTIGVTGSGTGMLYIDDIRLYKTAPPLPEPAVDPGTANLVALYAMEDNVNDGSGNGRNGTAQVGSSFGTGPTGYGKAIVLDGASGYVDLPIGPVVQSLGSATVATWVNWTSTDGLGRIFDFGTGTTANMWMAPNAYGGLVFAITSNGIAGESRVVAPAALPSGWHHVAVTIDGATSVMWMYLDGALADSETTTTLPSAIGNTTQNWIGRSQYEADPYFKGSVDDFRIYNRALSVGEVRYLVGDR
ncbi:MAG: LamG domain-containing protein, partial [Sedimentisphaerales bacterium]|nr:LamG domain-containing protein [Sedimentisphaerales bacterium]